MKTEKTLKNGVTQLGQSGHLKIGSQIGSIGSPNYNKPPKLPLKPINRVINRVNWIKPTNRVNWNMPFYI